jgi:hypothetical protein
MHLLEFSLAAHRDSILTRCVSANVGKATPRGGPDRPEGASQGALGGRMAGFDEAAPVLGSGAFRGLAWSSAQFGPPESDYKHFDCVPGVLTWGVKRIVTDSLVVTLTEGLHRH